jgi:hypothetical protein
LRSLGAGRSHGSNYATTTADHLTVVASSINSKMPPAGNDPTFLHRAYAFSSSAHGSLVGIDTGAFSDQFQFSCSGQGKRSCGGRHTFGLPRWGHVGALSHVTSRANDDL